MKKLTIQCSTFFFPRLIVIGFLFLLLYTPKVNGQEGDVSLVNKILQIIDTAEDIRTIYRGIAVTIRDAGNKGEVTPGWDNIVSYIDDSRVTIQAIRKFIPRITNIFKFLDYIPGELFDSSGIRLPDTREKLKNLLGLSDQPLSDLKKSVMNLQIEINSSLAQARANPKYKYYSPRSDTLPPAEYFYTNEFIREVIGSPGVVLAVAEVNDLVKGFGAFLGDAGEQSLTVEGGVSIVGEGITIGIGGNTSGLFSPYNIISTISAMINTGIQHISSSSTGAEVNANYRRLDHIHTDIDIVQDSLDSHIADFQVWKELSIRTRIETNLGGHGTHPHPIAIFQLPAQFDGYLEIARNIVESTINNMLAAGENVYQAEMFLSRGNSEYAANHWKKAYEWYSKSYDEATK